MSRDKQASDLILFNGKVFAMDKRDTRVEAVAVKDGKIAGVGSSKEMSQFVGPQPERIDLRGKPVFPGFIDAHTHVDLVGMMTSDLVVDCHIPPLQSVDDILEKIRERACEIPKGELILGQSRWIQPLPSREQLDQVAPDHPVILRNTMHFYLLNRMALKKYHITKDRPTFKELFDIDPGGIIYRDPETREPTGQVFDAWNYLFPKSHSPFTYEQTKSVLKNALDKFSRLGVTTIAEFVDFPESLRIYQELYREGLLPVRLHVVPCVHGLHKTTDLDSILDLGLTTGLGDEWIKFGGIKVFVDRGTETTLASIQLKEMLSKAHRAGIRVFMHANTRKGQDMALEAVEAAVESLPEQDLRQQDLRHQFTSSTRVPENTPRRDLRHRIEHMGNRLVDLQYLDRVKKTGAIALPTAYFMNIGRYFPEGLKVFLYRTMLDKGLCVPGNSDSGGSEPESSNPLYGIWCMVERRSREGTLVYPEEKISVMEAFQVYTSHSAFACLEEDIKGSIEPGKFADLVILDHDPFTSSADYLKQIKVEMTLVGGKIVYRTGENR